LYAQVAELIKAKFGALNEVELRIAVESMFKAVDLDHSGMIDVDELDKVAQVCGCTELILCRQ
jgi:Ca2+-binding EF-hand superfamily protein